MIPTKSVSKNVLLVGDSNLSKVNPKGLKDTVHKHAVPGATIKTLTTDMKLFNMKMFDKVIVYVGGNDIANNMDIELIEENYDQLITQMKSSNPDVKVYLSKIAPRGDTDVSPVNAIVDRLSFDHSIDVVDMFSAFHDKNGFINMRYIGKYDTIHPSTSGIKRILGTIDRAVGIVHDFDNVVFSGQTRQRMNGYKGHNSSHFSENEHNRQRQPLKCVKCGESNHETFQCRHRQPVTCWACGQTGHKQQHCWNLK